MSVMTDCFRPDSVNPQLEQGKLASELEKCLQIRVIFPSLVYCVLSPISLFWSRAKIQERKKKKEKAVRVTNDGGSATTSPLRHFLSRETQLSPNGHFPFFTHSFNKFEDLVIQT